MTVQQKLLVLLAWLLLTANLCPGVDSKRRGMFRGRGKGAGKSDGKGDSTPTTPKNRAPSRQGLKLVGAAAAGALGGAAVGYGLGSLGKAKQGYGYRRDPSGELGQLYQREGPDRQSYTRAAAPALTSNICLILGPLAAMLTGVFRST